MMKSINARCAIILTRIRRAWKAALVLLVLSIAALLLISCGGNGGLGMQPPPTPQGQGSVVVFAGDAPLCDVMSLSMTITGMTLTPAGGGSPVSVMFSAGPVTVDFASQMGTSMMLGSSSVPAGSYSQMTLTLSNPQMGMVNSGSSGTSYGMMNSTLATSSVMMNLNPPLEVQANRSVGMMLDMSLLKSLETASGAVTGTINPVFQGTAMTGGQSGTMMQGLGELAGIVQTVSTSSSNSSFSGSFTLNQWMMGRSFTVNVTDQTGFQGVPGLAALTSGTFVEVLGSVDANGNLVASQVDAEGQPDSQQSVGAFMGMLTAVTRGSDGNATAFQMGMNQEFPDMQSMMGILSQPGVTLASPVNFQIEAPDTNFAQFSLNATTLGPGQFLTVYGQITAASGAGMMGGTGMMGGGNGSLTADSVMLREQPLIGTVVKVLASGSDGKTGGFAMTPCSSVFGGGNISIPVLTSPQTSFGSLNGLSGMTANSQVVVNGLLFYEPTLTQANGMQLSPPGWVFEARQVGLFQ